MKNKTLLPFKKIRTAFLSLIKTTVLNFFKVLIKENPNLLDEIKNFSSTQKSLALLAKIPSKGKYININGDITITQPKSIILGNNVHIGNNCYFFTRAGLSIGDNAHLSRNITIYTSSHDYHKGALPYSSDHIDKPVFIGDNVWIGMNVNILPGVTIGEGAIIGMGATIAKNVLPGEIVVSQPHRVLKTRDMDVYQQLKNAKKFGGVNGKLLNQEAILNYKIGLNESNSSPVFILSTGRAGSTTIAKLLNQHKDVTCLHEPKYSLIRLATEYLHHTKNKNEVTKELKHLFIESKCHPKGIYAESDQKLTNLITLISEILPNAKFIWLIRKPDATVNSTSSRGWFSDQELRFTSQEKCYDPLYRHIFSDYRPQADKIGIMSNQEWKELTAFERNCWYWSYWNNLIKEQLQVLPKEKWIKIRLEEINNELNNILNFIGAENQSLNSVITNQAEQKYTLSTNNDWSDDMKASFKKWCLDKKLY